MKKLSWDSDFFGFDVFKIDVRASTSLDAKLRACFESNARLVYIFSPSEISGKTLTTFNGKLVDTKVLFTKKVLGSNVKETADANIIEYNKNISEKVLYKLALLSGQYSRFLVDSKIGKNKFEDLYKLWIDNSINKKFATKVYVYSDNEDVLGFITLKLEKKHAEIGLIAVHPNAQGKGIGSKLIKRVEDYLIQKKITKLLVPTQQTNKLAVSFYERNNFYLESKTYIYHFWN